MRFLQLLVLLVLVSISQVVDAVVTDKFGPYRVSLTTQPAVIPVGKARVILTIADESNKPLDGLEVRAIARMPGMFMGEREQRANPLAGKPGQYAMEAAFPMAGAYDVDVKLNGPLGSASGTLKVSTGQNLGGDAGKFSVLSLLPWVLGGALVVFVFYRIRATGQKVDLKGALNRTTIGGVLLIGALFLVATYAVNNLRRDGAMTPIEAQVMEMNTPAPPGFTSVQLGQVKQGPISETVRYSGQAVGYIEQDVNARGTGVIVSMSVYVGDKVRKGQVLARLDTSQLDPQLAERSAMTSMAAEGVGLAAAEYEAAMQEVAEARSEVSVKEGGVSEAQAMLRAAKEERAAMEAEVASLQSEVAMAQAEVSAAESMARFRTDEAARMRQLFEQKAVSRSELQQAESEAADSQAALRQARAVVQGAHSKVDSARANVRRATAMIAAAEKRVTQAEAEVRAAKAGILSKQKAADAAKRMISRERAAVAQARAGYDSAAAQRGYAELKSEVDGVVTERVISPGTLVNPGQTVLKVAQVSPIRLQANVAASDIERIKPGTKVWVSLRGTTSKSKKEARVSSVAPAVNASSRTGVVEVVWTNEDGEFQPGQFLTMEFEVGVSSNSLYVPVGAIQNLPSAENSSSTFVWVASPTGEEGRYTVKRVAVETGANDGNHVVVRSSLEKGQRVVISDAAYLKDGSEVSAQETAVASATGPTVEVFVTGYKPDRVTGEVGKPLTITFIRRDEEGCGQEIMFPALSIKKPLPLNEPVEVTITPEKPGEIRFTCGMDMYRGTVVVK